jgi:ssDNA-binding Zn-finger/Zn-ribbon topoisomerase 1
MLEEKGIGRPSTYAAIMTTILDREYVEKHEGRFHPTALGTTVNDLLVASFGDLFNESYTARMEQELDEIGEGKLKWTTALQDFYGKFAKDLKIAEVEMKKKKVESIPTDEKCENCGAGMVIKFGRFGQFLACSNYPECRTTREIAKPATTGDAGTMAGAGAASNTEAGGGTKGEEAESCELCAKPMALKRGRFGQFLGCTGYPRLSQHTQDRPQGRGGRRARAARRDVPGGRRASRPPAGTLRRVRFMLKLPCVQVHQTRDDRHRLPAPRMQGRDRGEKVEARQSLLRLLGVSEVRRGLLGQAHQRALPGVSRAVRFGEDDEEGHDPLVRQRGVRLQVRAFGGRRGSARDRTGRERSQFRPRALR